MKHLVDLEYLQERFDDEAVLSALYEHACELKIVALIDAIEMYWGMKEEIVCVTIIQITDM